ncbi:MAG: hypothetical protein VX447_02710 [Pseudomonadota bacterium]|uniref:hypothetical protein n=1 Tax=Gallaecimonas pentaromativorans TaxID=584787 RepID=UPI00067F2C57|nr:hypothetical protein [Gallaecimonas pentaromativorans]MED5523656.1 hypothetical protein [Pseudomonadota bacterium]
MSKKLNLGVLIALSAIGLNGCKTLYPKPSEGQLVNLVQAPLAPTANELRAQIKGYGRKIIIEPVETTEKSYQLYSNLINDNLKQLLMSSGNTVVERGLSKKFLAELKAAEARGVYKENGPIIADTAITVKLASLGYSGEFYESSTWKDKDGKSHRDPAYCKFESQAKLFVHVYKIPSMEMVNKYDYDGEESTRIEMNSSRCPINKGTLDGLYRAAISSALKSGTATTMNDLAPSAYIVERRDLGNESLYRVTINGAKGAHAGGKVRFYRKEKNVNPITKDVRVDELLIGEGEITDSIDATGAYVLVKDKAIIDKLMIGDVVKLKHQEACDGVWIFDKCVANPINTSTSLIGNLL